MNFKSAFSRLPALTTHFNDGLLIIYAIVMLIALFSPSLLFTQNFRYMQIGIIAYIAAVLLLGTSLKRIDVSSNLLKYGLYTFLTFIIFFVLIGGNGQNNMFFTGNIAKMIWYIFIIGMSESLIRIGLLEKTGNILITSAIMGIIHITSYMLIFGATAITMNIIIACLVTAIFFFIFWLIYTMTNDVYIESLAHGMYDFFITGGLI